jgi:hypothetical protein|tara:strand:+ start:903 stop:1676 length:774 start_codon:yes stop_codon:yes gene_type:complete
MSPNASHRGSVKCWFLERHLEKTAVSFDEDYMKAPSDHLYWARSKSESAPVEHKPLDAAEAAALAAQATQRGGAAWNSASTWEEKDISKWSHELLQNALLAGVGETLSVDGALREALPLKMRDAASQLSCHLRVIEATSVSGDATYVLSRGKQRVVFELNVKLKVEAEVREGDCEGDGEGGQGALKELLAGQLSWNELDNDALDEKSLKPSRASCEEGSEWSSFLKVVGAQLWPTLRDVLHEYVEEAKRKWGGAPPA